MGSMEEFIHYEKLIIFKRQLADPSITDERRGGCSQGCSR